MTTAPSRLFLIGHPVAHSLSPLFQNAALRHASLPVEYVALDVPPDNLPQTFATLRHERAAGNVTVPYKEQVYALCTRRTALAERVGAVNTFWFDGDDLVGDNTDVIGVRVAIDTLLPLRLHAMNARLRVAMLGAGGSAAAVLVALSHRTDIHVTCFSRTPQRINTLSARVNVPVNIASSPNDAVHEADIVINTTPIGLYDDDVPVDPHAMPSTSCALDLVYRRGETPWVHACRTLGIPAEDGLRMLVEQGAAAFERWFDIPADRAAMWNALEPRPASR